VANFVVPFFGGMPATGTIARTVTNVRSGATSPVSGLVHALTLVVVVLVAAPLAVHVPLAVLAGILLYVAWNMGEWREFARLLHFNLPYRVILLGTFLLTVIFDLTVGIEVGLLLACVFFIYRMSTLFRIDPLAVPDAPDGVQVRQLYGTLFFGTVDRFEALVQQLPLDTHTVVLQATRLISMDSTGLDALMQLHRQLQRRHIMLMLAELNPQPLSLMQRSGFAEDLGADCIAPTLADALAHLR
jgi:SulP family sulfate permease